jgi:hypothetical protein
LKYTYSLPLYRQEQQFSRLGINLSRQTMANWLLVAADPWLKIIYDRMHEQLVKRDILYADETTLQVLKEPGRSAESKSYMWLYRTGREGPSIVCTTSKMIFLIRRILLSLSVGSWAIRIVII